MNECILCHGKKYLWNEEKEVIEGCSCVSRDQRLRYFKPLRRLITPNATNVKPSEIINKSQVIVRNDQNMVGLIRVVMNEWFPNKYKISTLEDINEIGFERHPEFKSISDYVYHFSYHILDCSFLNKIRSRNEKFVEYDSMYAFELAKQIIATEGTMIIILPTSFQAFVKEYREMCECLSELGTECFRNGKYQPFLLNKEVINVSSNGQ